MDQITGISVSNRKTPQAQKEPRISADATDFR
jgi:hypothetical protein